MKRSESEPHNPGAKLFSLKSGEQVESVESNFTTEYAETLCPQILTVFDELGLADEFQAILGRHICDLHVLTNTIKVGHAKKDDRSRLWQANDKSEPDCPYRRLAIIDTADYHEKFDLMVDSLQVVLKEDKEAIPQNKIGLVVFEWILFELSADAAGNSCKMQFICDKYLGDYNGQYADKAELTIAYEFLSEIVDKESLSEAMQESEHANFRSGVALEMLRGSLVRHSIVDNWYLTEQIIDKIKKAYPQIDGQVEIVPLNSNEIIQRLVNLRPKPTRQLIADFEASLEPIEYFLKYQDNDSDEKSYDDEED